MDYNDEVMLRYGSASQKNRTQKKLAYDRYMQESEWRKEAIEGWRALIKHAELGSSICAPSDTMVIGVLGENCFDSFKEYKDLKRQHSDKGFTQLASAMIELNEQMIGKLKKVVGVMLNDGSPAQMVKVASDNSSSNKSYVKAQDVVKVLTKVARILDDEAMIGKVKTVVANVQKKEKVSLGSVKKFVSKYAAIEHAFKKVAEFEESG